MPNDRFATLWILWTFVILLSGCGGEQSCGSSGSAAVATAMVLVNADSSSQKANATPAPVLDDGGCDAEPKDTRANCDLIQNPEACQNN